MKTITITASRQSVFERVSRQMAWQGTRSADGAESYGRIALSESDTTLLHSFFDEAAMHAIDICRPFLRAVANTDDSLRLTLGMSDSTENDTERNLNSILGNLLAVHVLRQWLEIVSPEKTESCGAKIRDADSRLVAALYHHPAPVRTLR